jgi:hypothetical protein
MERDQLVPRVRVHRDRRDDPLGERRLAGMQIPDVARGITVASGQISKLRSGALLLYYIVASVKRPTSFGAGKRFA